jgi:cytochrome c-type biogenesis protein CcmH
MSMSMYLYGALLTLLGVGLLVVPMLKHRRESWVTLVLCGLIVIFPLAVVAIYFNVSSYNWEQQAQVATDQQKLPSVDNMVNELSQRMNEEPDLEGWILLGRSYASIGRYDDAVNAWNNAWILSEGQDPEVNIGYAEALIMADRRTLQTSAVDLLESALLAMPNDPRALWYGGLSAAARGQNELAAERFSLLLQAELPDNMRMVVQQQLAALGQEVPEGTPAASSNITTIVAQIDISPELRATAAPNDLMFLIARDRDQPKPPVAVKRVRVGDFPVTIKLSDNDVMIPGKKIKNVINLELIARISKSNQAFEAPGDLYGSTRPTPTEDGNLEAAILINTTVGE